MKKTEKRVVGILLAAILCAVFFTACGDTGNGSSVVSETVSASKPENVVYKIGLIQYVEHPSLDTIREAFMNRLEEWGYDETKVSIDYQNAAGDNANVNTICQKFVGDEVDLIVAIATPAAQVAVSSTEGTDIKVLFAAVSNPAEDLNIKNLDAPEGNITGTSDKIPVSSTVDLALQVNPELKTFGLLYNSGESNSVANAKEAREYCESKGIAVVEGTVSNVSEIQQVATNLCTQVDAIFTSTDNSVASSISVVVEATRQSKTPFYVGADSMVQDGAFAAIGIDYTELGARNADMAVELIEGKEVKDVPVVIFSEYQTYVNQETYDALGVALPAEVEEKAVFF